MTHEQALPLGIDDPIVAARAVRRALAAAGRRATAVTDLVIATAAPIPSAVLASFARRALGPHGSDVRTLGVVSDDPDRGALAAAAVAACSSDITRLGDLGVVIALGLAPDGTTEARCLGMSPR